MKVKGTFKFGEQNENVHYEIDKDKGYWRQWFDCPDKKRFSLTDILKRSRINAKEISDSLICCDHHFEMSKRTEVVVLNLAQAI